MEDEVDQTASPSDQETDQDQVQDQETDQTQDRQEPGKKSAEARIDELIAKNKAMEKRLEEVTTRITAPPPPPQNDNNELTPQAKATAEFLRKIGFVHKEELDKRDNLIQERVALDIRHDHLEGKYSGGDGRPTYDRAKVEDYMRAHAMFGDPESAYKLMHETELSDWQMKQAERKSKTKAPVATGTGTGRSNESAIDRDTIKEWLKTPAGRAKYEQNRLKVLDMMAKGQL